MLSLAVFAIAGAATVKADTTTTANITARNGQLRTCRMTLLQDRKTANQDYFAAVKQANADFKTATQSALQTLRDTIKNAGTDQNAKIDARKAYVSSITTARQSRLSALKDARTKRLDAFKSALDAFKTCRTGALSS